jgi:UDP-glucose-4-epimerase GalE
MSLSLEPDTTGILNLAHGVGVSRPRVLVTGGAGYIGSHAAKALFRSGYLPVTLDNLTTGHRWAVRWGPLLEGDLSDVALLKKILAEFQISAVLHFAASALVGESVENPGLYFRNNTAGTLSLLEAMAALDVRQIIFSSTCATYGIPTQTPIEEAHHQNPVNPYGESKLMVEKLLRWYCELQGFRAVVLRYFNAAGADPEGELGEEHSPETHLIPSAIQAALGSRPAIEIFGDDYPTRDGTAVRDFVHVTDLAEAHVRALRYLESGGKAVSLNLGTGRGFSVLEVLQCVERVTGRRLETRVCPRKPGDPPVLIAQPAKARELLGWTASYSELEVIVRHAWDWVRGAHAAGRVQISPPNAQERVAVIGAGPAGITAAYELARKGARVDVYEASSQVGGLAKSIELWGQRVDLGPHRFFSSDARVNRLWLEIAGRDYQMVDRLTRILYNNRLFYYPLRPANALWNLGAFEALRCGASYAFGRASGSQKEGSFEDWVVAAFGRRLFEIFFKTYSEKLWGISCGELDQDFAAQRIKRLSLYEAIKGAFRPGAANEHKTLVDRSAYPKDGTGVIYDRMAAKVCATGNNVYLETPVQQVVVRDGVVEGIRLVNGEFRPYRQVISSMPLTLLAQRIPGAPETIRAHCSKLRYRNTILVYLRVEAQNLFPDNWLYVHSPDLRAGRVTNFRNWSSDICRDEKASILALEYWCNEDDAFWVWDDTELIALASREIRNTGLAGTAIISAGHVVRIPRCYPVYQRGYKEHLKPIEQYLSTITGLTAIGRYGAFKYNNQDHSILMGILAANNILEKRNVDLWSINTDYEDYQEAGIITEAGLVTA